MSAFSLSAAILVGGASRRFGHAPKPLVEVGGERVIDRQLRALRARCEAIAVVSPRDEPWDVEGVERLRDLEPDAGPLAGIAAALAWSETDWVFVVAGDMPLLDPRWIDVCQARVGADVDVVGARIDGRVQPLAALYNRRCLPTIRDRLSRDKRSPTSLFFGADGALRPVVFDAADADASLVSGFNSAEELDAIAARLARE